ncbi:MAG: orotidine-5'-phosphate decarboxylase [Clostridia bacterium]|nr:orotidine-5'-phosphate decarboxylase [Clostridia bacterium]
MKTAIDRLIDKIKEMNNPTVIGLDPRYDMLPECIKKKYGTDLRDVCRAIIEYNYKLIDSVCDIVPAIKPQIAFYEMFGTYGIEAFCETCRYAKHKGMIVIADMKRGDIGTTAQAYSNAAIGKTPIAEMNYSIYDIDFVTVNPYLGTDGIKPFVEDCKKYNKGIFVLVKTSNQSSGELQDLKLEDGKTVYEKVAELVNMWGKDLVGENGYSSISSVVGATYPKQLEELRKIMPTSYFLIPGYGAQGGKADDIALGFDDNGLGGIVNASRSLMCAWKSDKWKDKYTDEQFAEATRAEAIRMRDELNSAIKNK